MIRAVFFDRDGTINEKVEKGYVKTPQELIVHKEMLDFLKFITLNNLQITIITNQQGIDKGDFSLASFFRVQATLASEFEQHGIMNYNLFYCQHLHGKCHCRKPSPSMINAALIQLGLMPREVLFIGDSKSDMESAAAAEVLALHLLPEGELSADCTCNAKKHSSLSNIIEAFRQLQSTWPEGRIQS